MTASERPETFVPVFAGRINSSGELEIGNPDYRQWLRSMKDRTVEVIVQEPYRRRTLSANSYYHLIVRLIHESTGDTEAEVHDDLKKKYLPVGVTSTAKLSRRQFAEYLEQVILFAEGWLKCKIPDARRVAVAA